MYPCTFNINGDLAPNLKSQILTYIKFSYIFWRKFSSIQRIATKWQTMFELYHSFIEYNQIELQSDLISDIKYTKQTYCIVTSTMKTYCIDRNWDFNILKFDYYCLCKERLIYFIFIIYGSCSTEIIIIHESIYIYYSLVFEIYIKWNIIPSLKDKNNRIKYNKIRNSQQN